MSATLPGFKSKEIGDAKPKHEIADILRRYLPRYLENHKLSPQQFKAVKAILACRTSALGGHHRKCDHDGCHHEDQSYNSCRNRHCPKCQGISKHKWLKKRLKELLPVHHYHVVFTLPHLLNTLALFNKVLFYDLLFQASSLTLKALASNPKYLGANMGFFGILHTWGQTLCGHPHVHYIVPGGGIAIDDAGKEHWIELPKKDKFLFPKKVMSDLFRGKFIALLKAAYYDGQLALPDTQSELDDTRLFEMFIDQVVNRRWNVFAKVPFAGPAEVLLYIGRYTHRVAISNHRILSVDKGRVSFEYKDYKDEAKIKEMSLPAEEFIRRFLLHILPRGYHKIHMYGFLTNSRRAKNIEKVRGLIQANSSLFELKDALVEKLIKQMEEFPIAQCPKCKKGTMQKKKLILSTGPVSLNLYNTS